MATPDGAVITAVRCENADGGSETLPADLVVDASGRGDLTLAALESIGRPLPEETAIGVDVGYATRRLRHPGRRSAGLERGVHVSPGRPESSRGALMLPLEGDRWIVTVAGRHGDRPPGDGNGFLTYARELRTPTVYNAIKHARRAGRGRPLRLSGERVATF